MRSKGVKPILVDSSELPNVEKDDTVYIVQKHPAEMSQQFSQGTVKPVNKPCIEYYAETFSGSLGSPVFVPEPKPTARSAVPGVSPGRGLLIPLGYLHPGKCEHSEVQNHPPCHGRTTNHRDYKRIERAFRSKSRDKLKHLMGAKSRSLIG